MSTDAIELFLKIEHAWSRQVLLIGIDIGVVVYILTAAVFYIERGLESEIRSGWLCPGS